MNSSTSTNCPIISIATSCGGISIATFAGKEKDLETGLSYFGARYSTSFRDVSWQRPQASLGALLLKRYYDADLTTGWLSVDPMADKYPGLSPYNYCAGNPVKLVDPDGREMWKPEVLADGSVNYIKEADDDATTLQKQYGLMKNDAIRLFGAMKNGKISESDVKNVTGNNILKLDWNSSSDYQKIYHAMAVILRGKVTMNGSNANMNNYISNLPSNKDKRMLMGVNPGSVEIRGNIALPLLDGKEFRATYASIVISKESPNIGIPQPIKQVYGTNDFTHTYNHPGGNLPLLHLRMDCTNMEKYTKVYY